MTIRACLWALSFVIFGSLQGCGNGNEIESAVPSSAEGWLEKSAQDQGIGAFEEAILALDQALILKPGWDEAHFRKAKVYQEWSKNREAMRSFKQALEISPGHVEALSGLAVVLSALKLNEEAIEAYKRIARIQPENASIHFKIALENWYIQNLPETVEHYKKAIEIDPEYLQAHLNLASVYEKMENWQEAIREVEIATQLAQQKGDMREVAIAKKKLPFLIAREHLTKEELALKSHPSFNK
ncbi:MAG: tetratricopeptide repeat protein [Candidatus Nitrohelix vancouverensis]|uniref:Tetratricopeptide repeat protein n=1 Tax=Candidatus Nitrohelix vancouverensis TaxID=2705534 RepID=A0A7T0C394_9BACT|nr:MAG: tetratricopeptide repeat protein [Candidatus Nitrohelix vancouverensis]